MESPDKFAQWLHDIGTGNAAKIIGVTEHVIRMWRDRNMSPRPVKALKIIKISHGLIDWKMIYEPYAVKKAKSG